MYFFLSPSLSLSLSLSLCPYKTTHYYIARNTTTRAKRESNKERAFESNNKERSSIEGNSSRVHPTKKRGFEKRLCVSLRVVWEWKNFQKKGGEKQRHNNTIYTFESRFEGSIEEGKRKMLKLKSRAVLETPTTGLSRQLSKTGINNENEKNAQSSEQQQQQQQQLLKANDDASQQQQGQGAPSQKPSIHRYPGAFGNQPRFAPSQQPPPFSQDFDAADYCTPADQQFELVGNITYANNMKNSSGGGAGGNESQQGLQPFDSCEGKENGMSGKGYFSSMVQNTTGKQFGMRSPVALSPMRHKRARLGCVIDSPNVSQQMYNNESNRGALDVINGAGNSSGLSGLRFQQLSSQQMQLTPRESSQPFTISRAGSLPQACLQYSQGGGNRNSVNANNNMFEVPPIPSRQQQHHGGADANAKKEKLLQSPPISRMRF